MWKSYYALDTATQSVEYSTNLLLTSRFEAAQQRYLRGVGGILKLMNTQAAFASAKQRRVRALADWSNARFDLGAKLGRLTPGDTL